MKRSKLRILGEVLVVVFTVLAGIAAMGIWLLPAYDAFGQKEGRFVEPEAPLSGQHVPVFTLVAERSKESRNVPYGNGLPTVVSFPNKGMAPCLIEGADFRLKSTRETPNRLGQTGAVTALPVNFRSRHYDRKDKVFRLKFQRPHAVPEKEWATLEVAIIEPAWVGNTYVGTLTVRYNRNQSISFRDVELDVLARLPEVER